MRAHKLLPYLPIIQKPVKTRFLRDKLLFPSLLSIELTNHCNASCIMCPRKEMTRKKGHMEFSLFKKIINDCRSQPLKKINLFWFGESLLYPKFLEALEYIKENLPLVKVNISTNADRLDPEISRHIIASELVSTLNIDLDGINRETAERIRPGTDFSKVMNNIHSLLEIKHGQSSPRVSITIIKMKDNRAEIDDFIDYWRNKVDQVEINSYNTWMGKVSDRGMEKNNHGLKRFDFPCEHPWNELVIASDGRSSLCCLDFDCQTVVGDANKDSLTEIWTGPKIDFYRKKLLKNDYRDIICEHCNAYIFQEDSFWRSIFL